MLMKKIIKSIFIIMLTSMLLMASACSVNKTAVEKPPGISALSSLLKQSFESDEMIELDGSKLQRLYGIKPEDTDGYFVMISASNIKAREIALIKPKNTEDLDTLKEKVSKRAEKLSSDFKDYLPEEYFIIQNSILKTEKGYLFFVISPNADKIEKEFDRQF